MQQCRRLGSIFDWLARRRCLHAIDKADAQTEDRRSDLGLSGAWLLRSVGRPRSGAVRSRYWPGLHWKSQTVIGAADWSSCNDHVGLGVLHLLLQGHGECQALASLEGLRNNRNRPSDACEHPRCVDGLVLEESQQQAQLIHYDRPLSGFSGQKRPI